MATANPPSQIPLVQRPPTRLVSTGGGAIITIAAGGTLDIIGSDGRQDRIQIVITNMDAALYLLWGKLNGHICGAVFAQLPWTLETSADIRLTNPNGSDITLYVAELYPDTGNLHGVPSRLAASISGGGTSGGGTTGGTSGGSTGGYGSGSSAPGGTQPR